MSKTERERLLERVAETARDVLGAVAKANPELDDEQCQTMSALEDALEELDGLDRAMVASSERQLKLDLLTGVTSRRDELERPVKVLPVQEE